MSDVQPPAASQPPAGWYPDPQNAQQQRYWDGSTWTGHTAASAAAVAPTGSAPLGGAPLPIGAPTWQAGAGGMAGAAPKAWYKRTWVLVVGAIVVILVVLGVIGSLVSTDHSNAMEKAIKADGQTQLQAEVSKDLPGATVDVSKVDCVKTGGTQEYSCLVNFSVTSNGTTQNFFQHVAGECDNDSKCLWHTTEEPQESAE
jgi:hypothetical protein